MKHERKTIRLQNYDYSLPGAYFVTICTADRRPLFWVTGARVAKFGDMPPLSDYGEAVEAGISGIERAYPSVAVDSYVIMPNHVHLLLIIRADESGRAMRAPTVSTVICQMKGYVTKKLGRKIWQKAFYEHVVRNERDLNETRTYIANNPIAWNKDELFFE